MNFSADLIDDRLWLGNLQAAENSLALEQLHITHVLTVIEFEIKVNKSTIKQKQIFLGDDSASDLLIEIESAYEFIDNALSSDPTNNVLIHCQAGISRSASIACMWLMRRYNLDVKSALARLHEVRPQIFPNSSFTAQLYIFDKMNHRFDSNHPLYKQFQRERARELYLNFHAEQDGIETKNQLRQQFCDSFYFPVASNLETIYRCRQCQTQLFTNIDLTNHPTGRGLHDWFKQCVDDCIGKSTEILCEQKYFTTYLLWLRNQIDTDENLHENSIECPTCRVEIGIYSLNGKKCSCNRWVLPSFFFTEEAVDRCPVDPTSIKVQEKQINS